MKILIVGAGSIARRHIKNLNSLGYEDIDVVDPDNEMLVYAKKNFKIDQVYRKLEKILSGSYEVAFVLTPPSLHVSIAIKLAGKGIHLFIEKPLSNSIAGVDELIRLVEEKHLIVMVGYNQRFNRGVKEIKKSLTKISDIYYVRAEFGQYLPDWRPWQDYRKSYSSKKELGGGILLDASHEIDYVLWMVNKKVLKVSGFFKKISSLDIDVEDLAEIHIEFEDGVMASIHMNMVERGYNRRIKIIGENGNIKYDFYSKEFSLSNEKGDLIISKNYKDFGINQMYIEEIEHFLDCIETNRKPLITLEDGRRVIEIVLGMKDR